MPLQRLDEFYPDFPEAFMDDDVTMLDCCTEGGEEIGVVEDVLVDDKGRFRYLVIHTDAMETVKSILLPVGLARIDYNAGFVFVDGLTPEQVNQLPEYQDGMAIDQRLEKQIRITYSPNERERVAAGQSGNPREPYDYSENPALYEMTEQRHGRFKALEEQLRRDR